MAYRKASFKSILPTNSATNNTQALSTFLVWNNHYQKHILQKKSKEDMIYMRM